MRQCWAAVALQRTKQRICIDLITGPRQKSTAIIAAQIETIGRNGACVVKDSVSCVGTVEDRVPNLDRRFIVDSAQLGDIVAKRAVIDLHCPKVKTGAACGPSDVTAYSAVGDCQ